LLQKKCSKWQNNTDHKILNEVWLSFLQALFKALQKIIHDDHKNTVWNKEADFQLGKEEIANPFSFSMRNTKSEIHIHYYLVSWESEPIHYGFRSNKKLECSFFMSHKEEWYIWKIYKIQEIIDICLIKIKVRLEQLKDMRHLLRFSKIKNSRWVYEECYYTKPEIKYF
jgi:hypothetical protein